VCSEGYVVNPEGFTVDPCSGEVVGEEWRYVYHVERDSYGNPIVHMGKANTALPGRGVGSMLPRDRGRAFDIIAAAIRIASHMGARGLALDAVRAARKMIASGDAKHQYYYIVAAAAVVVAMREKGRPVSVLEAAEAVKAIYPEAQGSPYKIATKIARMASKYTKKRPLPPCPEEDTEAMAEELLDGMIRTRTAKAAACLIAAVVKGKKPTEERYAEHFGVTSAGVRNQLKKITMKKRIPLVLCLTCGLFYIGNCPHGHEKVYRYL